ncbi:amidohydrolase [Macrococcus equipercicus]|uniref:Amidohydrolase n=1 Tax=Macrococcus equipercicus TaxID=69967 RepID=A0ABQ6R8S6_9STAP|nr:amidohydrolase family protein [Macrococcus equipercicus]KAA1039545.1 amidohydrolase [Macrococcus equipercicus]
MKSITFEEHFTLQEVQDAWPDIKPDADGVPLGKMLKALEFKTGFTDQDELTSHHQERLQFMDEQSIGVQVLSYGNRAPSGLTGQQAVELCRLSNDRLAEYIQQHPDRFLGFAVLPINEPEAAVQEMERAIKELGFKGVLIAGHPADGFLEQPQYAGIFAKAEALDIPIYLHPAPIGSLPYQHYYKSDAYSDETAASFASFGYGWHVEVGLHAIRLVLSGLFDRHPNLQMIIGHWGEFTPFFLERMDEALMADHLEHPISYYFKNNFYITPSGMLTRPQFDMVREAFGIERILYAADYPYIRPDNMASFLESLDLTYEDQERIAFRNAERLLKL